MMKEKALPVLVTTEHRGVFFGYQSEPMNGTNINLIDMRCCIYWDVSVKGFVGLAAHGPNNKCKIGPKANGTLFGVTSIIHVSPEAVAKWEAAPWST